MISAGRDLLHGAPEFRYTRNGIHKTLKSATLKVLSESPEKVTLAVNGGNEDMQVSGTIAVEYDGAVIYRLSLEPRHRNIRDFALLLRLNPAEAQMILEGTEHTFRDEKTESAAGSDGSAGCRSNSNSASETETVPFTGS